jgi:hypothetical protein
LKIVAELAFTIGQYEIENGSDKEQVGIETKLAAIMAGRLLRTIPLGIVLAQSFHCSRKPSLFAFRQSTGLEMCAAQK